MTKVRAAVLCPLWRLLCVPMLRSMPAGSQPHWKGKGYGKAKGSGKGGGKSDAKGGKKKHDGGGEPPAKRAGALGSRALPALGRAARVLVPANNDALASEVSKLKALLGSQL